MYGARGRWFVPDSGGRYAVASGRQLWRAGLPPRGHAGEPHRGGADRLPPDLAVRLLYSSGLQMMAGPDCSRYFRPERPTTTIMNVSGFVRPDSISAVGR